MNPPPAKTANVPLHLARSLALLFALALLAGIIWAASATSLQDGLRYLAADRWGLVTLIDVYAGAVFVATWMWVNERRLATWIPWLIALLCLGHLVSLLYLLLQTRRGRPLHEAFQPAKRQPAR